MKQHLRLMAIWLAAACIAASHPMGNFSVSHYARLAPGPDGRMQITFALDLAELPSFEMLQKWNLNQDSPVSDIAKAATGEMRDTWVMALDIMLDGNRQIFPGPERTEVFVSKGAGNMVVIRVVSRLTALTTRGWMQFEDRNFSDRKGWREIAIGGSQDATNVLSEYPVGAENAVLQARRAIVEWDERGIQWSSVPAVSPEPRQPRASQSSGTVTKGDYLSNLLSNRDLNLATLLAGLGVALTLGAMHALTPGHGKTMVAAYLVGERGKPRHAVILGIVTTFTHTAVVFLLGIGTYLYAGSVVPESVTQTLGVISGLSIVAIGGWLLYQRLPALIGPMGMPGMPVSAPVHAHDHRHDHSVEPGPVSNRSLIALGASGGLVPCPSALVLLLSALAIGRVGVGLVLLVAFSFGLASVLIATGLVTLYAKSLLPARISSGESNLFRYLPVASAAAIIAIGFVMTAAAIGWVRIG